MSGISTGVGLISGINIAELVDSLIALQRASAVRMERRIQGYQSTEVGLGTLEAKLLTLSGSIQQLQAKTTFNSVAVANTDEAQLRITAAATASPGSYQFQTVRKAATHAVLSKGFANSDQQPVGTGTLTVAPGGFLERPTLLSTLNGGDGVRRGTVRITDRNGKSADFDLSNAYTLNDVLNAINDNAEISVTARADGDRIVLTDTSGAAASNLTVVDLNGGSAAQDLGIAKSVAAATLTGNSIYAVTGDFTLDQLNDGNGLRLLRTADSTDDFDIRITLQDDTVLEIDLDEAATLNDVIAKINDHASNGGKLVAALVDGRLELTDQSGGGGSSSFTVENNAGNSEVVEQLGLNVTAAGNTITGRPLLAGLNSVLLRNLNGGAGITTTGKIKVTDRTGKNATLDLTGAESLDAVLNAINAAETANGTKLQLTATLNSNGTGIIIEDTSGSTAGNLIISDVGSSTLAADLGIVADVAADSINSGGLNLRYVNEATRIDAYAPGGKAVRTGSFVIVNSQGQEATVTITSAAENLGDVLQRINNATAAIGGFSVTAQLNETGDGFVLVDAAGGALALEVKESGGNTAADLRILGTGVDDGNGNSRITSRLATIIDIEAGDTLEDVVQRINDAGAPVQAAILNDGSAFNSKRLSLVATTSGFDGRFALDDGGLGLNFSTRVAGQDALLRNGSDAATGFLVASSTNRFDDVVTGVDIDLLKAGTTPADVTISRNFSRSQAALEGFVASYNGLIDATAELTKFDLEANTRGVLQGSGVVLRVVGRLDAVINRKLFGPDQPIRSLSDLGVRVTTGGKLTFDTEKFAAAAEANPDAVSNFFLAENSGFGAQIDAAVKTFTDPFTGTLALEKNALTASVESLTGRIEQLDQILEVRRERLLRQFINMESALAALTSQQQALSSIAPLRINRTGGDR